MPIIVIIYSLEFFTSVLADGLSLEFKWRKVSSSLQDSSQYPEHFVDYYKVWSSGWD